MGAIEYSTKAPMSDRTLRSQSVVYSHPQNTPPAILIRPVDSKPNAEVVACCTRHATQSERANHWKARSDQNLQAWKETVVVTSVTPVLRVHLARVSSIKRAKPKLEPLQLLQQQFDDYKKEADEKVMAMEREMKAAMDDQKAASELAIETLQTDVKSLDERLQLLENS